MLGIVQMAGRPLEEELNSWKVYVQMFVRMASKIVNDTPSQQTQLQERVASAQESLIR